MRLWKCLWSLALLAVLSSSAFGSAQQELVTVVRTGLPHDALFDVQILQQRGIAVGAHGAVLETADGGQTWTEGESLGDVGLMAVTIGAQRSIVVGQQGSIFVASGSGPHQQVDSGSAERLLSVALDEDSGLAVAVGGFGTVLVSDDAGESWRQSMLDWESLTEEGMEAHLYDVAITGQGEIFVVGEFGLVLVSGDGGETWEARAQGDASLFALHIDESATSYAAGQDGAVLRSIDNGRTWEQLETGSRGNMLDIWASPQEEVVVVGIRTLLRSADGGDSWVAAAGRSVERAWYQALAPGIVSATDDNLSLHQQKVYAVGQTGKIVTINH